MSSGLQDFIERSNAKWQELKAADALAKQRGELVGRYVTHPHADGQAVYVITDQSGKSVTVGWVDVDDAWVLPAWGKKARIPTSKAQQLIGAREFYDNLANDSGDWWASRKVGETVHYHNGFGTWVRGVIVNENGENRMRPTALVGPWKQFDLWTRSATGEIRWGYHVERIKTGETFKPHASNMFENGWNRDGNPTKLTPLEFTPPEMDANEEKLARLMKFREKVLEALNPKLPSDKEQAIAIMQDSLILAGMMIGKMPK